VRWLHRRVFTVIEGVKAGPVCRELANQLKEQVRQGGLVNTMPGVDDH
jgi:translation initiation factor 1 (eIF-1/SUI1)